MADGMNFDKYIDNPSGGSSVVTNRRMYKDMYKSKFDKVLLREMGTIKYTIYKANDGYDSYYIHMLIPSEVIEKFYYDVVVRLFTTENKKKTNVNLREYAVQFFSNDPAFVYTFAHAFAKNRLFIPDLEKRMSQQALRDKARVKNPKDEVWYVKSLYFAYLTMEKYNLFNRTILDRNSKKYDKKRLLSDIVQAEEKVQARQDAQEKLNKKNADEKKKASTPSPKPKYQNYSKTSKISTVSKTSKVSSSSKVTKQTKTVKRGYKSHTG